ncbi:MAG: DUF1573 domain-containing protein [Acidobacteria bacterium]|nr:DUF1573 domain-containing protein [Acidobacteriota bacterium]
MHKQLLATVIGAMLSAGVALAQHTPPKPGAQPVKPILSVEHSELDLGKVPAGQKIVATFIFHNSGEKPVKILKAAPS